MLACGDSNVWMVTLKGTNENNDEPEVIYDQLRVLLLNELQKEGSEGRRGQGGIEEGKFSKTKTIKKKYNYLK